MPLLLGGSHGAAVLFALVLQQGKSMRRKFSVYKESGQRRGRVCKLMFQSKEIHYWFSK